MNGITVEMTTMDCKCGQSARYDKNNSVSFVDAWRMLKHRCTCPIEA
jgi:hypothetical protein